MDCKSIIKQSVEYLKKNFEGESSGHDWQHVLRVWQLSKKIALQENKGDLFVIEMGALLHDIADHKFHNGDDTIGPKKAEELLNRFKIETEQKNKIIQIVEQISFKGLGVETPMTSIEGEIVQDADRLDAMGAIGIARTFAYGGSKNREIFNPSIKPVFHASFSEYKSAKSPTINHFYEKLLHLKERLNTKSAIAEGEKRHQYMEDFLRHFFEESFANQNAFETDKPS